MIDNLREQLKALMQKLFELLKQALAHPRVEELYNRWLQKPERTRQKYIQGTKFGLISIFLIYSVISGFRVVGGIMDLWAGQKLLEKLVDFKIRSEQLKSEIEGLSAGGGLYDQGIDSLLQPMTAKLQITPGTMKLTPKNAIQKGNLVVDVMGVEFERLTVKQLVDALHHIQSSGANLSTQNLTMKRTTRGWYQVSFEVARVKPKEG